MSETIVAISTAPGEGAIGIVRISGDDAHIIGKKIFKLGKNNGIENRKMHYGHIVNKKGEIIDEVLCLFLKGSSTYTCEDMVEIHCHGSIVAQRKILEETLQAGAVLAEPGEFTKRAFFHGRLDLSQAEAVIDMIKADTDNNFEIALSQMEGSLSEYIKKIREKILAVLAKLMVNIDFPDEDIEEESYENLEKEIKAILEVIENLADTAFVGKIYKEGIRIAIVGKPNVGKSSLLNILLGENRAIVTEIAGTTRDTISEKIQIGHIPALITDTAGMRAAADEIEKIGIDRSKESFNISDIKLLILDGSKELEKEDLELLEKINKHKKSSLAVINKMDKKPVLNKGDMENRWDELKFIETSIVERTGIKELKDTIEDMVLKGRVSVKNRHIITNSRHKEMLLCAVEAMKRSISAIEMKEPFEIIELDIKDAYENLGKILGESISEEIVDEVFSKFCLGK